MSDLKPCPFCGASKDNIDAMVLYPHPFAKSMLYVMCRKCGGAMIDLNLEHCLNDVKTAWNRRNYYRIPNEKTGKWINPHHGIATCSVCGRMSGHYDSDNYNLDHYCSFCGSKNEFVEFESWEPVEKCF